MSDSRESQLSDLVDREWENLGRLPDGRAALLAFGKMVAEECAKIAARHRAPERKIKRNPFADDEAHAEMIGAVLDEERGERIAAECIAKEIRAWIP